jgi:hypothetical protein
VTQPNEYTPPEALSSGGLADFAVKTQFDWATQQRNGLLSRFLPAQLGFFGLFDAVAVAQKSANFANITNTITKATTLAAAVTSGVAVTDAFNGTAANDLGASWTRTSTGSGSGFWGPNGTGSAVWKASGGVARQHYDRHSTPLFTDFQAVMTVVSAYPQVNSRGPAYTYLVGRADSNQLSTATFVYLRIGNNSLALGKCVAGTFATPWVVQETTNVAGDQISFLLGTNASQRNFIVVQNGFAVINHTEDPPSSAFGASNRYVGVINSATFNPTALPSRRTQISPAALDLFAAADRQSSTT